MHINDLTSAVIGAAIEVHKELGPGLLESAYHACLLYELGLRGLKVESEVPMPVVYKEIRLQQGYRLDLFVENKLVVEIKAVEALHKKHIAQTLTYLKFTKQSVGLLLNFNEVRMTDGIKRLVR